MYAQAAKILVAVFTWTTLVATSSCQSDTGTDTRREIAQLQTTIEEQKHQLVAQKVTIDELNKQLQVARALTDDDLTRIFYPEKIQIDSLSGGEDYDGKPGDDGVTVYLRPIDRDGDALKVAGDIRIELYDLQNPGDQKQIGEYYFPVDTVRQLWYGKLSTYHYTLRCPWKAGPPAHNEITIRATFVDYLTQRVMTAQTVCKVKSAP